MNNWELEQAFIKLAEAFPALAQAQRTYYEELLKSGFSEDEALYLVSDLLHSILDAGR